MSYLTSRNNLKNLNNIRRFFWIGCMIQYIGNLGFKLDLQRFSKDRSRSKYQDRLNKKHKETYLNLN